MRSSTMKFFFPILILVLYYQSTPSEGDTGNSIVEQTCNRAAQSNPSLNYDFCVKSLQASPKSNSADLRWLGIITTSLAKAKAEYAGTKIDVLLAKTQDPYDKERLNDCKELYSKAYSAMKQAKNAFKSHNYFDANVHMGSALDNAITCEDSWKEETEHVSLLSTENQNMQQLCRMGLAISNFLPAAI